MIPLLKVRSFQFKGPLLSLGAVFLSLVGAGCQTAPVSLSSANPNELVKFLDGRWENVSIAVLPGQPVQRQAYDETIKIKDGDTVEITAHGMQDGKDVTKDMVLVLRGDRLELRQGDFVATGEREDRVYSLRGNFAGREFRFRLYTLGDRFVFHRETWVGGKIEQVEMSYLLRKK